ncbi:MAG: alpha/beta hydrolase fold domain-containing protein [Mangrovibacterium sp.]
MKLKAAKKIGCLFAVLLLFFCLLMVLPRLLGWTFPEKPPVGYHFEVLDYLAVGVGLEKVIVQYPRVPDEIEEIKDIEYKNVNGKSLQLDLYRPKKLSGRVPLLVFIHGGSWKSGKRSDYLVYLVAFAQKGYMTATVSYRLLKESPYPACAEDVTDAVRWLMGNGKTYGYDPSRICLIGGSAGAHLALLAAYGWGENMENDSSHKYPKPIKAVVDIYGPADLTTPYARQQHLVTDFIAHSWQQRPDLFQEASPIRYVTADDPPTLILHGTSDNLVPLSQSDSLKARLDKMKVPCIYHRLPLWPHTMDVVQRVNDFTQSEMDGFFEQYLR